MKSVDENTRGLSEAAVVPLMRAVFETGGRFRLLVRGTSMRPFIRNGDQVTLAALSHRELRLGDVVAYCRPNDRQTHLVIHRIVRLQENEFIIQGDRDGCGSDLVPLSNILGRVVEVRRKGWRVRLGLGPERPFLAWMSRTRLLHRVFARFSRAL